MIALAKNRLPWKQLTQSLHDPHVFQLNIGRNLRSAHLIVMQSADPAVSYAVLLRPISNFSLDLKLKGWAAESLAAHFERTGAGADHEVRPFQVSEYGHLLDFRAEWQKWGIPGWEKFPRGKVFVTSYDAEFED